MKMQAESIQYSSNNYRQTGNEHNVPESTKEAFSRLLAETKEEFEYKLEHGETKPSYAIGSNSYTEDEWNKMLSGFDRAQEKIREAIREEAEKLEEKALEEKQEREEKENKG